MPFEDRREAGIRLAAALSKIRLHSPVVVALPRGGVPVAAEISRALDAPLEVLIVRKIGAPWNPEYALGAMIEGGHWQIDEQALRASQTTREEIGAVLRRESSELERRVAVFRENRPFPPLRNREVILVDDGIATGATAAVAVEWLRARSGGRILLAVPVSSIDAVQNLAPLFDELICLETPSAFRAVGDHYRDFNQLEDSEVLDILRRFPQSNLDVA